jgi:hypothetical protein
MAWVECEMLRINTQSPLESEFNGSLVTRCLQQIHTKYLCVCVYIYTIYIYYIYIYIHICMYIVS